MKLALVLCFAVSAAFASHQPTFNLYEIGSKLQTFLEPYMPWKGFEEVVQKVARQMESADWTQEDLEKKLKDAYHSMSGDYPMEKTVKQFAEYLGGRHSSNYEYAMERAQEFDQHVLQAEEKLQTMKVKDVIEYMKGHAGNYNGVYTVAQRSASAYRNQLKTLITKAYYYLRNLDGNDTEQQ